MGIMILVLFLSGIIPDLCLSSCCLPMAPPVFTLSAPPRPPGLILELPCTAGNILWANYNPDNSHNILDQNNKKHPTDHGEYNWTGVHHVPPNDEIVHNTSSDPTISEKKLLSVGMILGIVIGVLLLFFIIPLVYFFMRCKRTKYQSEPTEDQQNTILQTSSSKMHAWFRRNNNESSKKFRNLFRGIQRTEGSISSTSSESGYCEDVLENQENTGVGQGKIVVTRRNRSPRQRPISSRPVVMTEATPDIIASTQKDAMDDETPKRWSLFGLLPSLKPLLTPLPGQLDDKPMACGDENDLDTNLLSTERQTTENKGAAYDKHSDAIPMNVLTSLCAGDKQPGHTYGELSDQAPRCSQATVEQPPRESARHKKSKVRIRNDSMDPEIEV